MLGEVQGNRGMRRATEGMGENPILHSFIMAETSQKTDIIILFYKNFMARFFEDCAVEFLSSAGRGFCMVFEEVHTVQLE